MKEYVCECGRVFTEPNRFNGHKKNCLIHMISCGKEDLLEDYATRQREGAQRCGQIRKEVNNEIKRDKIEKQLKKWISEQHTCERCGKVMTEKFGSGRFCCRACANTHLPSEETKRKISKSIRDKDLARNEEKAKSYNQDPDKCKICGAIIPFERRGRRCCGTKECLYKLHSLGALGNNGGGYRAGSAKNYKYGTYKNIYCDSSWELAFLVYCLDNNIDISRNTSLKFPYIYNNEEHFYIPDFILDDCLVEIKGRNTDEVDIKSKSVPEEYHLKVISGKDINPYLQYVKNKYGNNFCEVLYDRNYPCYLDRNNN